MEATLQNPKTSIDLAKYEDLFNYQAPFLEEKLFKSGKFSSKEEYDIAFLELKKYFLLNEITGLSLSMTSTQVDEVWHQFILFTKQYHTFCEKFFGDYIHHVPNTSFTPMSENGTNYFVDAYIKVFGEIPKIWGITVSYDGTECSGCNSCSQGARTGTHFKILSVASCSECNGCGTGQVSCEP